MNTRFFKVEGKSKMSNAENPLFIRVFEFREAHIILIKGVLMGLVVNKDEGTIDEKSEIVIESITHLFPTGDKGEILVLDNINLEVRKNEFTCIMGPSGCGKTTLLNVIAGLLKPTSGTVKVDNKVITGPGADRAVVFQNDAVFPWMTVEDNIAFGLTVQRKNKDIIKKATDYFLNVVNLEEFRKAWPKQLSGGMRKRVDIARAYVANPEVLLLDEPFGSLDVITKEYLQEELLKIWLKEPKTVIFVTHDVEEALFLGDRVVIMTSRPGRIKSIFEPDFPKNRTISIKTDKKFVQCRKTIRNIMEEELYVNQEKTQ